MATHIIFSFDDARKDTKRAIEIAKAHGIISTLNVTTSYVNQCIDSKNRPSKLPAMTREDILELANDPFVEFASHSQNHTNQYEDIKLGHEELASWLNEKIENLGFVSPCSMIDFDNIPLSKFKEDKFAYVRIGPKMTKYRIFKRWIRKFSRLFQLNYPFYWGFRETLQNTVEDNYLIHSVPIFNDNTLDQVKYLVNKSIEHNFNCVLMFHSILAPEEYMGTDNWSWDIAKYKGLCKYLENLKDKDLVIFSRTIDLIKK